MRFFLVSDNADTAVGMRLAGIEGVVVHGQEETEAALDKALADRTVAIVLITECLAALCPEKIDKYKLGGRDKLIVEIPDRHGSRDTDSIAKYVRESIGIKI